MRLIYPEVTRNGFGNNVITLAKAWLIAETNDMTYQRPVWPPCEHVKPPTPNGYGYYFPTTRADEIRFWLLETQFRVRRKVKFPAPWPTLIFSRADYYGTGIADAGEAAQVFLKNRGLDDPTASVVMRVGGMWGGYGAIKRAKGWVHDLMLSHDDTRRRLDEIKQQTESRMRVAVQIRMGDFQPREVVGDVIEGERAVRLPIDWYMQVCRLIRAEIDCLFILITDGTQKELKPFLDEFNPVHTLGEAYQDLLGALLIAESDLVVCSNSTYSRLGCFLNEKPYIWPADMLFKADVEGFGYLWQDRGSPVTNPAAHMDDDAVRRCFALSLDFTQLPGGLKRYLNSNGSLPVELHDDLLYRDAVYIHQ
jgi:hypothetical protein